MPCNLTEGVGCKNETELFDYFSNYSNSIQLIWYTPRLGRDSK